MVLEIELISKTYSITFNEHDSELCSDGNKKLLYLPNDTAYKHATMQWAVDLIWKTVFHLPDPSHLQGSIA